MDRLARSLQLLRCLTFELLPKLFLHLFVLRRRYPIKSIGIVVHWNYCGEKRLRDSCRVSIFALCYASHSEPQTSQTYE